MFKSQGVKRTILNATLYEVYVAQNEEEWKRRKKVLFFFSAPKVLFVCEMGASFFFLLKMCFFPLEGCFYFKCFFFFFFAKDHYDP